MTKNEVPKYHDPKYHELMNPLLRALHELGGSEAMSPRDTDGVPSAPSPLDLRPATEADRPFLWRLHRATMRPYVEATWGWDEEDQRRRFDESFDPDRKQIVLVDGAPVGVLEVVWREDEVFLAVIEIAPAWQGRGIGTRLIRRVVEEAGERPVALRVLKANPAQTLYARLGFEATGETETHVEMRRA